jgi:ATP-dependent DNA helicase RecQ
MRLPAKQCIVRAVFEMLGERPDGTVAACGRCPACRSQGLEPPHTIRSGGLECIWPASPEENGSGTLPWGATLVIPSDPTYETGLERLVSRLAAAGLEQFVVADDHAVAVAELLARLPVRHGFVLGHNELHDHPNAEPARLPTAILLPYDEKMAAHLLSRCRKWIEQAWALPVVVTARADLRIGERRLDQIVSRRAPYQEEILDALAGSKEVAG